MNFLRDAVRYLLDYPRFCYSLWRISQLRRPLVTIFGGKQVGRESEYYELSYELAQKITHAHMSVLTGGGPGIMESSLCGAKTNGSRNALGIGVLEIDVEFSSRCRRETIFLPNFAARKHCLIRYSEAFIAFPGGVGTFDEVLEVLNLMKTEKIRSTPLVLIGKHYWKYFDEWFSFAVSQGYILQKFVNSYHITDDIQEAFQIVKKIK